MRLSVSSRAFVVSLFAALAAACGGAPDGEASLSTASADTTACTATTSCAGIVGAPPDIVVTCIKTAKFYAISPSGTSAYVSTGTQYTGPMDDYSTQLAACTPIAGTSIYGCQYFSTYAPTSTWCPSSGTGGTGGTSGGGKTGCYGTCQ